MKTNYQIKKENEEYVISANNETLTLSSHRFDEVIVAKTYKNIKAFEESLMNYINNKKSKGFEVIEVSEEFVPDIEGKVIKSFSGVVNRKDIKARKKRKKKEINQTSVIKFN